MTAIETHRIAAAPNPVLTEREAQEWTNSQIPYPNLAGNKEIAERALIYLNQRLVQHKSDMRSRELRWRWLDFMLRGNTVDRTVSRDVHVPEVLKALLSLRPRIVEAVFGNGRRWFEISGVDRRRRMIGEAMAAFFEWQLEQSKFTEQVDPGANSILKYEMVVWKVTFDRRVRQRVHHEVESTVKNGRVYYDHKRRFVDEVEFEGNLWRLVDPYNFVFDVRRYMVEDLDYVGDVSEPTIEDLRQQAKLGLMMNVEELAERYELSKTGNAGGRIDRSRMWGFQEVNRQARSGIGIGGFPQQELKDGIWRPKVFDCWCWFDLYGDGHYRRCNLTMAEGTTMLVIRENPHDDGHHPYAIGRSSANGFEFFEQGILEPAMRLNAEMDHHRANVLHAHDNIVGPQYFVKGESDLPKSIYSSEPGTVHKNAGEVAIMSAPNTLQAAPYIDTILRRDVEEVTGAPRLYEGSNTASGASPGTATEVNRKIEESNRRLLGTIRAFSLALERGLRIMHANCQQYVVDKTLFRVLDRQRAKLLGDQFQIGPQELLSSVDFTMLGIARVQQYGLRATNLLTWSQTMMPVIQSIPGDVDLHGLLRNSYRLMVGEQGEDDIVRARSDPRDRIMQSEENQFLLQGIPIRVDEDDQHDEHIKSMRESGLIAKLEAALAKDGEDPPEVVAAIAQHLDEHIRMREQQRLEQKEMMRRQAQQQALQGEQEAPAAGGMPNQTNGPPRAEAVGPVGRQAKSVDQDRNAVA